MCQISDRIFSEGRIEGMIESIIALTEAMHVSDEQAMEWLQIDMSERLLYASRVKEMRAARGDNVWASV